MNQRNLRFHQLFLLKATLFFLLTRFPEDIQAGSPHKTRTWLNATIPYRISKYYDEIQVMAIKEAMEAFEAKTCIQFTEYRGEQDYIHIKKPKQGKSLCSSYHGRNGRGQPFYLSDECIASPGTVKHVFMHAIGFVHEQSRSDRDDYVDIHYDNIEAGSVHEFRKYGDDLVNLLNTTYDLKSIMHYEWNAFAIDITKPTITAKDGSHIEPSEDLSRTDILDVNRLYKCNPGNYEWLSSNNGQVKLAKNCSFFGRDINQYDNSSSEECIRKCLETSLCTHFTWDSDGSCFLSRNSFNDIYPSKKSVCGYIYVSPRQLLATMPYEYYGIRIYSNLNDNADNDNATNIFFFDPMSQLNPKSAIAAINNVTGLAQVEKK